ncbi:phosphoesterase, MJ0936 family [Rhizobiales bacterium GAS191]|nr:phosphoesterase, MJ0936 family [Rhizobiales bacterium GAS113]SED57033.1 phosphoesterase, MJ0936 family [Rhizobiales bacterium GAS188]SEE88839.1 phosphoesterase, MJ0936 family [Rhizobiales bacterium GAS191]
MRIAVLADIHGNALALEAVLADVKRRGTDLTVDLGDCVSGPLWPRETLELLAALGAPTVRGNHDRQVATLAPDEMGLSDRYAHGELSPQERAKLGALPMTRLIAEGVLACHATPERDDFYLIEDVADGQLRQARPEVIAERLGKVDAKVVLCGHSHRVGLVQLARGQLVLNPGSVGGPAYDDPTPPAHVSESGSTLARYAVLEMSANSVTGVEFLAIPYAHEEAARRAQINERPDWAHALRTGFVSPPG